MKTEYAMFYLEGREERLIKADIDTADIAQSVVDGNGSIHELLRTAVSKAAEPLRVDRKKRQWIEDWEDEIAKAGGDKEEAYRHFCDGRIDELVFSLEAEVIEEMTTIVTGEEPDDDDEEDDEEEDDDDEGGAE
jgi:hypothetical protein